MWLQLSAALCEEFFPFGADVEKSGSMFKNIRGTLMSTKHGTSRSTQDSLFPVCPSIHAILLASCLHCQGRQTDTAVQPPPKPQVLSKISHDSNSITSSDNFNSDEGSRDFSYVKASNAEYPACNKNNNPTPPNAAVHSFPMVANDGRSRK
jgi:hypothetical protein